MPSSGGGPSRADWTPPPADGGGDVNTALDDSSTLRWCPACSVETGEPVLAGPDGRCSSCGQPLVINADHVEKDLGQVVGVSDRGLRHHRNEDAFHIAVVPAYYTGYPVAIAIISDGVRSAPRADEASLTAVRTGMKVLAEGTQRGDDAGEASVKAFLAAARAVTDLRPRRGSSCDLGVCRGQRGERHGLLARQQPRLLALSSALGPSKSVREGRRAPVARGD